MHSLLGPDFVGYVDSLQGGRKERADLLGVDKSNRTRGAVNDRSAVDDVPTLPNALVATTGDNQHHKDGTSLPVREHRFRAVGYWYYCCDVTVEMGPTLVVSYPSRRSCGHEILRLLVFQSSLFCLCITQLGTREHPCAGASFQPRSTGRWIAILFHTRKSALTSPCGRRSHFSNGETR
eukprot:SAG31_NODE_1102_length_9897_cov_16.273015_9_plen_179_part_00